MVLLREARSVAKREKVSFRHEAISEQANVLMPTAVDAPTEEDTLAPEEQLQ